MSSNTTAQVKEKSSEPIDTDDESSDHSPTGEESKKNNQGTYGPVRKAKDKLKHSRNETRRRARLANQFNNLRSALNCDYKDRFSILQHAIDVCTQYMKSKPELQNSNPTVPVKSNTINIETNYKYVPIFIIRRDGTFMNMNTAFLSLFNMTRKTLENSSIFQFFHQQDHGLLYDIIQDLVTNRIHTYEHSISTIAQPVHISWWLDEQNIYGMMIPKSAPQPVSVPVSVPTLTPLSSVSLPKYVNNPLSSATSLSSLLQPYSMLLQPQMVPMSMMGMMPVSMMQPVHLQSLTTTMQTVPSASAASASAASASSTAKKSS